MQNGGKDSIYYCYTDNQSNLLAVTNQAGTVVDRLAYDPWGVRCNPTNWTQNDTRASFLFARGYTMHEHLDAFGLINMNGRVYDPVVARFLSPDPYVQSPSDWGNYNRYGYCFNNPLMYTDPSGEFFWDALPLMVKIGIGIGAGIGAYTGYKIGEADGASCLGMAGYVLGGAVISGFSGYLGGTIAAGGGFLANTSAIMMSSYTNSMGMTALSGGQMSPSISFGFASYNFGTGDWSHIGKKGNSFMEDLGYGLGALANIQDLAALNMGTNVDYNAMKHPTGHGSLTSDDLQVNISKGFESGKTSLGKGRFFTWGKAQPWGTAENVFKFPLSNVNKNILKWMTNNTRLYDMDLLGLFEASYSLLSNTCTSQVVRSLWYSSVWGTNPFTIHPMSLYMQLMVRQSGISASPYLYQISE